MPTSARRGCPVRPLRGPGGPVAICAPMREENGLPRGCAPRNDSAIGACFDTTQGKEARTGGCGHPARDEAAKPLSPLLRVRRRRAAGPSTAAFTGSKSNDWPGQGEGLCMRKRIPATGWRPSPVFGLWLFVKLHLTIQTRLKLTNTIRFNLRRTTLTSRCISSI